MLFRSGEGSGEGCCVRPFQLSWRRRLLQGRVTLGLRSGKGLGRCRGQAPWVGGAWVGTSTKVASLTQSSGSLLSLEEVGWGKDTSKALEEGMATHSSILAWRIPWTEEPDGLQSTGSQSWT